LLYFICAYLRPSAAKKQFHFWPLNRSDLLKEKRTLLFLVRHGETEWNSQQRYQGQTDIKLNAKGRRQARAAASRLSKIKFSAVYASDLKRAAECAEIIAAPHKLKVQTDAALRERCFGVLEGLTRSEGQKHSWWKAFEASDAFAAPPGGETRGQMRRRVVAFAKKIAARHEGENILIVAHGGTITQIIGHILGISPRSHTRIKLRLDNCSLSIVQAGPDRTGLLLLNDTSHLFPKAAVSVLAAMEDKAT
jgi:broad specificity phosphatase PhoE